MGEKNPFRLLVNIKSASNLPIADLTTSDPYVQVWIGDKKVATTRTIYKNHLHPVWDEHFIFHLLHTNCILEFRIFDEDRGKAHDYLGIVEVNIASLAVNEVVDAHFPVKNMGGYKAKATLEVSMVLSRNQRAVSITSDDDGALAKQKNVNATALELVNNIQKDFEWGHVPDSVQKTFLDLAVEGHSQGLSKDLVRDLLYDVSQLTHRGGQGSDRYSDLSAGFIQRTKLKLVNAKKHYFKSKIIIRHPPIEDNSIQVNLCADETKFVVVTLPNRFSMWTWAKWLQLAYDVWSGSLRKSELPEWASNTNLCLVSQGSLAGYQEKSAQGRVALDLERPFELQCGPDTFSLRNMVSMVISADSWCSKQYVMEVDVGAFNLTGAIDETALDIGAMHEGGAHMETSKPRFGGRVIALAGNVVGTVTGTVSGVVRGAANAAVSAKDVVVDTTVGVASTAVGAVQTVAKGVSTGNPILIIREAQGKVIDVGSSLASTLTNAPQSVFGKVNTFATLRCEHYIHLVNAVDNGTRSMLIDFNLSDIGAVSADFLTDESEESSAQQSRPSQSSSAASRTGHDDIDLALPPKLALPLMLDVYLMHGVAEIEKVVGQKCYKVGKLLDTIIDPVSGRADMRCDTWRQFELPLDNSIQLEVSLGRASRLAIPSDVITSATGFRAMFAKCKVVDRDGHSRSKGSSTMNTPVLPASAVPNWNWFKFVFGADSRLDKEAYVRIEIVVEKVPTNLCIGAVFIPLEYFGECEQEYTFPVTRFRMPSSVVFCAAQRPLDMGELTVRVRKRVTPTESKVKLNFRTLIRESNLYNNCWFGECIAAGALDVENIYSESVTAAVLMEGLKLVEIGVLYSPEEVRERSQSKSDTEELNMEKCSTVDSLALTEPWNGGSISQSLNANREADIVVYQNQRRTPYPPFDWSNSAYTRANFSDLEFRTSYKLDDVFKAEPPEGWEWVGEWKIDKTYAQTDSDGWSYGVTFGKILSNYKRGRSYSKPINAYARRRKWVRKAQLVHGMELDLQQLMNKFEKANDRKLKGRDVPKASPNIVLSRSPPPAVTQAPLPSRPQSLRRSGGGGGVIGVAGGVAGIESTWRKDRMNDAPFVIIGTCREKREATAPIIIPWDQIRSHAVVTPSVVSIVFLIDRYFQLDSGMSSFRPAEVEIYISNCPAKELNAFIEDRIMFYRYHRDIKHLVQSGNLFGRATIEAGATDGKEGSDDGIPETEELSMGSETMAALDDQIISLENRIAWLRGKHTKTFQKSVEMEMSILLRRAYRLRLYMAAMIGVGLTGVHGFTEKEVTAIMESDFRKARRIQLENSVATANNRVEYLLDMAEKRIRDAALCGWKHRGENLQRCLEIFANGYFIEIVGILGVFFEDVGQSSVKGLTSKVELINTYMKHNDRLDVIIESALRPYGLKAKPAAKLSLFLDLGILVSWYTSVLTMEMRSRVESVLDVWKDASKDVTGRAQQYKFPLPWIPQRAGASSGIFFTNIPEDLVEMLMTYLTFARIRKENIAPSFQSEIWKLDTKVCLAYTNAFLHLAEGYQRALGAKNWYALSDEEEFAEYITFLCSVANDASRMRSTDLLGLKNLQMDESVVGNKELAELSSKTLQAFDMARVISLDQLSCVLFIFVFHEADRAQLLNGSSFLHTWATAADGTCGQYSSSPSPAGSRTSNGSGGGGGESGPASPSSDSGEKGIKIFRDLVNDMMAYVADYEDFLQRDCCATLKHICGGKAVTLLLALVRDARAAGFVFDAHHPFVQSLCEEALWLKRRLEEWLSPHNEDRSLLRTHLYFVECFVQILRADLSSPKLDGALTALRQGLAQASEAEREAQVQAIKACLSLRGVKKFFSSEQLRQYKKPSGKEPRKSVLPGVPPSPSPSPSSAPVLSAPPAPHPEKKEKRGSILGFLGNLHLPHSSAPLSSAASTQASTAAPGVGTGTRTASGATGASVAAPTTSSSSSSSTVQAAEEDLAGEAEELRLMDELNEQRNAGLVACIEACIDQIRFQQSPGEEIVRPPLFMQLPVASSPIVRVFGTDPWLLRSLLLHSALRPSQREAAAQQLKSSGSGSGPDFGLGSFLSNVLSMTSAVPLRKLSGLGRHAPKMKGDSEARPESVLFSQRLLEPPAGAESHPLGEPDSYLTLHDLCVADLFYLDYFRAPKPFLVIRFGGAQVRTASRDASVSACADWMDELPIQLPVYQMAAATTVDLEIILYYEGFLSDNAVALLRIPIDPHAPPSFHEKRFPFVDFSDKAQLALHKARDEGRGLPSVSFSLVSA